MSNDEPTKESPIEKVVQSDSDFAGKAHAAPVGRLEEAGHPRPQMSAARPVPPPPVENIGDIGGPAPADPNPAPAQSTAQPASDSAE